MAPGVEVHAPLAAFRRAGRRDASLVVFDDELAASHFLRVARKEMERAGVEVPLWVSHGRLLTQDGALEKAWSSPARADVVGLTRR